MLRKLRTGLLLYVLLMVAIGAWLSRARTTDWDNSLWVAVYPINGDGSARTQRYIDGIDKRTFAAVETFMMRESARYGIAVERPVRMEPADQVHELPPQAPTDGNVLAIMLWSLKLRFWANGIENEQQHPTPDIQIFAVYHDPDTHPVLQHSLGMEKGLIGVVNTFASRSMTASNNFVITHELLHTLGATDKYNPATNAPRFPEGYAEPDLKPLHPQRKTEIMGGRRPVSTREWETPDGLNHVVAGPLTADEINWRSQ